MSDFSFEAAVIKETICAEAAIVRAALIAPHVLYKPDLAPDGTKWCALLGSNIMEGVVGFGDTPAEAMADFDRAWHEALTPYAMSMVRAIEEEERREEAAANGQFGVGA